MSHQQSFIDFNIFENKEINEHNNKCKSAVSECKSIHRILTALQYYQMLNKNSQTDNNNGQTIFSNFLSEEYKHYLDDIIHLKACHPKDLEEIHQLLLKQSKHKQCDINKCILIDRHCQIDDGINGDIYAHKNKIEAISSLHIQIWDSVHYYLVHLFEVGLRDRKYEKSDEDEKKEDDNDNDDKWGITDNSMNKRGKEIEITRKKLKRFFARFTKESNKFTIKSVINSSISPSKDSEDQSMSQYFFSL